MSCSLTDYCNICFITRKGTIVTYSPPRGQLFNLVPKEAKARLKTRIHLRLAPVQHGTV